MKIKEDLWWPSSVIKKKNVMKKSAVEGVGDSVIFGWVCCGIQPLPSFSMEWFKRTITRTLLVC